MTFTTLGLSDVTAANLANYDTIVLNVAGSTMGENTNKLSAQAKADLVSFVGSGHKLIIYDSESTPAGGVDYTWLPYSFTTNNPGQAGAFGTLTITEENTLSSSNASSPYYIDASYLGGSTDAVGDANVMTTLDPRWCVDMAATNTNQVTGPVHTYATYSNTGTTAQGLFIYNGLDMDMMGYGSNSLRKIWVQELQQPFNPVTGLPCAFPVVGIKLTPDAGSHGIGQTHTVTATLTDLQGHPNVGVPVTFSIIAGPNMGATGTLSPADGKTDASGQVTFTYVGTAVGTDTIGASFINGQGQTINAQTVTSDWTQTGSPPVSVDKTFFTHVDMTLSIPGPGALSNDTDPDPDHTLTLIPVSNPTHGSLTLNADGSFVYKPQSGFVGQDSFQYKATDGYTPGNIATVTLVVYPGLGITMNPASDSGRSNTDQITNVTQPNFRGTAEPGSVVQLVAQASEKSPMMIGQMTVGADGTWSISSNTALHDGRYNVSIIETHPSQPGREAETTPLANPVIIDTVGPWVTKR